MGMGDCVLEILLREKGILEKQLPKTSLDYFVAYVDEKYKNEAVRITMQLRSNSFSANFSYKAAKLNKQLKLASDQNARRCVIVGQELEEKKLAIKDMSSGEQKLVELDEFLSGSFA